MVVASLAGSAVATRSIWVDPNTSAWAVIVILVLTLIGVLAFVALISVVTDGGITGLISRWTVLTSILSKYSAKVFAQSKKSAHTKPPAFSTFFAQAERRSMIIGLACLTPGLAYAFKFEGYGIGFLCLVPAALILIRHGLTSFRAQCGYLGSTSSEAEELVAFTFEQKRRGGLPPGTRTFAATTEDKSTAIEPQAVTVEGRS